jgi:hypothetical protein
MFSTSYADEENCDYEIVHAYLTHDVCIKEKFIISRTMGGAKTGGG